MTLLQGTKTITKIEVKSVENYTETKIEAIIVEKPQLKLMKLAKVKTNKKTTTGN